MKNFHFHPDQLMSLAQERTDLSDFGPDHFLLPLTHLCDAIRSQAQLNESGVESMGERLLNALSNRLRRVELVKRFPEINDEVVSVRAVIVGLPRTGSTLLQRVMCQSKKATGVVWWESVLPLPLSSSDTDRAQRISMAKEMVDSLNFDAQGFESIHPLDAEAYDEELPLMEQSFVSNLPESMMYVPAYGEWLAGFDQSLAYDELIQFLKILQWQEPHRRGQNWILKCPHHLTASKTVLDKFPDAKIIMTHRDILDVLPSWFSMVNTLTKAHSDVDFGREQAAHWFKRLSNNLRDTYESKALQPDRFIDLNYKAFLADPLGSVKGLFEQCDLEVEEADIEAWRHWLAQNRRGDRPRHTYDLREYSITEKEILNEFAFYIDSADL